MKYEITLIYVRVSYSNLDRSILQKYKIVMYINDIIATNPAEIKTWGVFRAYLELD